MCNMECSVERYSSTKHFLLFLNIVFFFKPEIIKFSKLTITFSIRKFNCNQTEKKMSKFCILVILISSETQKVQMLFKHLTKKKKKSSNVLAGIIIRCVYIFEHTKRHNHIQDKTKKKIFNVCT